jgi:hypothetical protein
MKATAAALVLLLTAALGAQPSKTYYWRDSTGQTHITNTPPPPGAEVLDPPPPPAVERSERIAPVRQSGPRDERKQVILSPSQQQAWAALDQLLAKARAEGNTRTLESVANSLIHDCLWGNGLWAMPVLPVLCVTLMGLMGWWLALGMRPSLRATFISGFLALGLAFGHVLLGVFLYHPQAMRLRQNLELLERHRGTRKELPPERRGLLQERLQAVEQAADPIAAPWRFPAEVQALRETMQQVMVEP